MCVGEGEKVWVIKEGEVRVELVSDFLGGGGGLVITTNG